MVVLPEKTVLMSLKILHDNGFQIGKDVFYRLKNRETMCWHRILWYILEKFIKLAEENNTSKERTFRYLIFDDTTVEKSGKKMEFLGRVQ